MAERTGYTPGTFCWADLTSTDPGAAKDFYSGLFGWEAEDIPVGEGVFNAGPIDIGVAKLGVVQDPQGATFALYAGPFEP